MTDADLARWEAQHATYAADPLSFDTREECDELLGAGVPALIAEVRRLRKVAAILDEIMTICPADDREILPS